MYFNTTEWVQAPYPVQDVSSLIAIGDIHGHAEELLAIYKIIKAETETSKNTILVHLGDYIDRGPSSYRVLDVLSSGFSEHVKTVYLAGNHDQYLIELVKPDSDPDLDRYFVNNWYENGGLQTIKDLDVEGYGRLMDSGNIAELQNRLRNALGKKIMRFLLSLDYQYKHDNYLFVHAGIDPTKDLENQDLMDLLLIREPFLSCSDTWKHPFCVVHGHSISTPAVHSHRIGVDAGVYLNGSLCAVQISGAKVRFLGVNQDKHFPWNEKLSSPGPGLLWREPKLVS